MHRGLAFLQTGEKTPLPLGGEDGPLPGQNVVAAARSVPGALVQRETQVEVDLRLLCSSELLAFGLDGPGEQQLGAAKGEGSFALLQSLLRLLQCLVETGRLAQAGGVAGVFLAEYFFEEFHRLLVEQQRLLAVTHFPVEGRQDGEARGVAGVLLPPFVFVELQRCWQRGNACLYSPISW